LETIRSLGHEDSGKKGTIRGLAKIIRCTRIVRDIQTISSLAHEGETIRA